jgi:hypothetical protein
MLDDAPSLLCGAQKTLVGDTVLIVAENVAHVRKEFEQDIAEVGFRFEIGPLSARPGISARMDCKKLPASRAM